MWCLVLLHVKLIRAFIGIQRKNIKRIIQHKAILCETMDKDISIAYYYVHHNVCP